MSPPACPVLPELPELPGAAATGRWRAPRRLAAQALALQGLGLGLTLVAALVASHLQHRTRLADFAGHTRVLSISLQDHLEMAQRDLERLRDLHYRIDLGRDELEIAGETILRESPWIRLFSWLPRVTQTQRNAFEEHRDGLVRPATRRAEHFPVADTVPASGVHAVVVEDDEHSRDILVHLLERLGCRVEVAHDGLQGLRLIRQTQPDIVFTDIRMPVLDGLRMLAQLHASAATLQQPTPPVVAVSASSLEHERRHYIEQGFSDFVGKPYAFEEIHRMLAQHAGARFIAASPEPEPGHAPENHAPAPIPAPCPPAPAAALEADALAMLEALRQAALDGQMRAVRHELDRIDAAARLPAATRERLRRTAQDYAFDDLARQIEALPRPGAGGTAPQDPHTP